MTKVVDGRIRLTQTDSVLLGLSIHILQFQKMLNKQK